MKLIKCSIGNSCMRFDAGEQMLENIQLFFKIGNLALAE